MLEQVIDIFDVNTDAVATNKGFYRILFQGINQPNVIFLVSDISAQLINFISFAFADNWLGNTSGNRNNPFQIML